MVIKQNRPLCPPAHPGRIWRQVVRGRIQNQPLCPPGQDPDARANVRSFGRKSRGDWEAGLSAQRIYQDLVSERQFKGSYDAVKRFVRQLGSAAQLPFRRMESEPGEQAQVDFGQGGWVTR